MIGAESEESLELREGQGREYEAGEEQMGLAFVEVISRRNGARFCFMLPYRLNPHCSNNSCICTDATTVSSCTHPVNLHIHCSNGGDPDLHPNSCLTGLFDDYGLNMSSSLWTCLLWTVSIWTG